VINAVLFQCPPFSSPAFKAAPYKSDL